MTDFTIIGIDLSLTATGLAIIDENGTVVTTIKSSGKKDATLLQRTDRLGQIRDEILPNCVGVDLVVIEGPSFGQARQGGQHDRAGLWWMLVDAITEMGAPVAEVPPSCRAKYATGKGNAAKDVVLAAVVRRYPAVLTEDNNQADALVLAAMGARHLGHPIDDMPALNLTGMEKVQWPGLRVRCAVCGCTDDNACLGGCWWVSDGLCSSCSRAGFEAVTA